ncbi:hypothetical protein [Mycobacterium sp. RTGN5]|uniref:hypothetical protein n=1 Tax=Mycobacterium sp. RTGN5 TaxID=3016522 RepID=UPI0029C6FD58|nr:hypothetical protein [Mycobacterium sp. RTGN5]
MRSRYATSGAVTCSLPYIETGRTVEDRRDRPDIMVGVAMTPGRRAQLGTAR